NVRSGTNRTHVRLSALCFSISLFPSLLLRAVASRCKLAAVTFVPFELERWQSTWENRVRHNISESGVHPLSIHELLELAGEDLAHLADLRMVYSQANGTDELRAAIAALYPGATPDHVLVTVGSAQANYLTCWSLLEPGNKVAMLAPTYWQTWGLSQNFGADV